MNEFEIFIKGYMNKVCLGSEKYDCDKYAQCDECLKGHIAKHDTDVRKQAIIDTLTDVIERLEVYEVYYVIEDIENKLKELKNEGQ